MQISLFFFHHHYQPTTAIFADQRSMQQEGNAHPLSNPKKRNGTKLNYRDPDNKFKLVWGIQMLKDLRESPHNFVERKRDRKIYVCWTPNEVSTYIGIPLRSLTRHYQGVLACSDPMKDYHIASGRHTIFPPFS
mmetsp:Transcript_42478/g.62402  ORF Transcript_42478/g.62402 Transcript_42478/m.62402 type:complete len:134 (-) Transcript_42478:385-786(-)